MRIFKRCISLLLVLGILLGVTAPAAQAAPVEETASVDTDNVTIEGTNGFGNLLAQEITENQQETETENEDYSGGYTITDLEIVDNVATVTYDSMEEAQLVVALHTEDGMQLVTSAKVTVTPDATVATVTFEGEMPEYFMASAYLLDQYDYSPLCDSYDTPMYTREMQELLSSTVDDYDPEKVLNLDDDDTTNFAVYADSTIVIAPADGVNTVASADDDNMTYVIMNADTQMTALSEGDVFVYPYGEDELLIVKVAGIHVDGTTVTITGADLDMEEVFSHVKMESDPVSEDMYVIEGTGEEGITYVGLTEDSDAVTPNAAEGGATAKMFHKFEISKTFSENRNVGNEGSKPPKSIKLAGTLKFSVEFQFEYYISLSRQYVKFAVDTGVDLNIGISGELTKRVCKLPSFGISPIAGVYIGIEPQLEFQATAELAWEASYSFTLGFSYSNDKGGKNLTTAPKLKSELKLEGTLFFGFDLHPTIEIIGGAVMDADLIGLIGFEINGKLAGSQVEYNDDDISHDCKLCIQGDLQFKAAVSVEIEFLKCDSLKIDLNILEIKYKLTDYYYSFTHGTFGLKTCPYTRYRIVFEVRNGINLLMPDTEVLKNDGTSLGKTNKHGVLSAWLPLGKTTVKTNVFGKIVERHLDVSEDDAGSKVLLKVDFFVAAKDYLSGAEVPGDTGPEDSEDMVTSGQCGKKVYWKLSQDGLLEIMGTGPMTNFTDDNAAPWYSMRSAVTSVMIEGGVTSIGDYAFYECSNAASITIPDSVISIGNNAFRWCESLTNVTIPASVTSIGNRAFFCCFNLAEIIVDANNPNYTNDESGVLFDKQKTTLIRAPGTIRGSYVIPDGVKTIADTSFADCDYLTGVIIPESVTRIDDFAFANCNSLENVDIRSAEVTIGEYAFNVCYSLVSITIPEGVSRIDDSAFGGNLYLKYIYFEGDAPQFGANVFSIVTATAYYPSDNASWTPAVMQGYGGTIAWIPYTPAQGSAFTGEQTPRRTENPSMAPQAVYGGEYDAVDIESATVKFANFSDLVPGEQYVMLALVNLEADDSLAAENLLAIDQGIASEDGTLSFQYIQRTPCDISYVVACGASNRNLNDAEITFPEMTADGDLHAATPTVVYDGKTLIEDMDYIITGAVDYTETGEYTCYIRGIRNYTGLVECVYTVNKANTFTDVEPGSFYIDPVLWAVENGITNGATPTTFDPSGTCLRAQVVTFLHRAAGNPEPTSNKNPFTDVKPDDFFHQPVLWAVEKGITNGISATTFGSYANCNRAAVVTFLWRAAGSPEPESTDNPFVDVKTTDFFYKSVLWAVENGITNGVDATHFGPTTDCNRAQVVTFLYRAYN